MNPGEIVWNDKLGIGKIILNEPGPQGKQIIKVAFLNFWPLVECSPSDIKTFIPSEEFRLVLNKIARCELGSPI